MTTTNDAPAQAIRCSYCGDTGTIPDRVDGEITCPKCGYDAPAQASVEVDETVLLAALLRIDAQRVNVPENVRAHLLQAAKLLAALAPPQSPPQSEELIEALRKFADFKNCSPADVYHARELTGMLHLNETDNFASLASDASPRGEAVGYCTDCESETTTVDGRCSCGPGRVIVYPLRVKPLVWNEILTHGGEALSARFGEWGWRIHLRGAPTQDRAAWIEREKAKAQSEFDNFILSALASDAGPRGEPVEYLVEVYGNRLHFRNAENARESAIRHGTIAQPLYAHPAPATVEMLRDAIDLAIERLDTYRGSAVEEVIDLLAAALASTERGKK